MFLSKTHLLQVCVLGAVAILYSVMVYKVWRQEVDFDRNQDFFFDNDKQEW